MKLREICFCEFPLASENYNPNFFNPQLCHSHSCLVAQSHAPDERRVVCAGRRLQVCDQANFYLLIFITRLAFSFRFKAVLFSKLKSVYISKRKKNKKINTFTPFIHGFFFFSCFFFSDAVVNVCKVIIKQIENEDEI